MTPGSPISQLRDLTPQECPVTDTFGHQCASDCRTLLLCVGTSTPEEQDSCSSIDSKKPYCVDNVCTSTPDTNNKACQTAFKCTAKGVFPDPSNCSVYWDCSGLGVDAKGYACPDRFVYASEFSACRPRNGNCQLFNCGQRKKQMIPFPPNRQFYAYCDASASPLYVLKCSDSYIFDLSIKDCRFDCKRTGAHVDPTSSSTYILCSSKNGRWVTQTMPCPENYIYVDGKGCVSKPSE